MNKKTVIACTLFASYLGGLSTADAAFSFRKKSIEAREQSTKAKQEKKLSKTQEKYRKAEEKLASKKLKETAKINIDTAQKRFASLQKKIGESVSRIKSDILSNSDDIMKAELLILKNSYVNFIMLSALATDMKESFTALKKAGVSSSRGQVILPLLLTVANKYKLIFERMEKLPIDLNGHSQTFEDEYISLKRNYDPETLVTMVKEMKSLANQSENEIEE